MDIAMHHPTLQKLHLDKLMEHVDNLPKIGKIAYTQRRLLYLDVSDEYIYRLFPLIQDKNATIPDYFAGDGIGAHISVIYPEESQALYKEEIGKEYQFTITGAARTIINHKHYFLVTASSPGLLAIRHKYHLSDQLSLKGFLIDFHITIGVSAVMP
jgi:hypothetical protein